MTHFLSVLRVAEEKFAVHNFWGWALSGGNVRTLQPSFFKNSPKFRIFTIAKWHKHEMAKNNRKVVAPGLLVICPVYRNRAYHTKKKLLAQNIPTFRSKLHIFVPSDQIEPHRSMFHPLKAKFGPKYAFLVFKGQILAVFAHFVLMLTKNQCDQGA